MIVLNIIAFIFAIGIIILIHEAGHFTVLKKLVFYVMNFQ